MAHVRPRGLSTRRVQQLLSRTESPVSIGERIEVLSRQFLGRQYSINPLIGTFERPEIFTVSLDGLDCVTYVEMVLALSRSASVEDYVDGLRKIRYADGIIAWDHRNHYMTGWIRKNVQAGFVRRLAPAGVPSVRKDRILDALPGLKPVHARFACVPKRYAKSLMRHLESGDLIFFASIRAKHDIFHCGIAVRDGDRISMRHASRSRGGVIEQSLDDFLKMNRMAGIIVVRPNEVPHEANGLASKQRSRSSHRGIRREVQS